MRTWRVGSFSMGALLIFLGILLVLSQQLGMKASTIFLAWWPIILIVLGIEILIYIYIMRKENSFIKYDFLSIIFVSFIGMVAIAMTILMSTGLFDKVHAWTNLERTVGDLPEYDVTIDENIDRIVISAGNQPLTIEDTTGNDVHIFGIYHAQTIQSAPVIQTANDYVSVKEKGNTLYMTFKDVYSLGEPFQEEVQVAPTILIPSHLEVEIDGSYYPIQLNAKNIQNDWLIKNAYQMNLYVHQSQNLTVQTKNVDIINDDSGIPNEDDTTENQSFKFGDGKHQLSIVATENLTITER